MLLSRETTNLFAKPQWRQDHPCPNCGRTMQLVRSAADSGGISGICSYGCAECGLWTSDFGNDHDEV